MYSGVGGDRKGLWYNPYRTHTAEKLQVDDFIIDMDNFIRNELYKGKTSSALDLDAISFNIAPYRELILLNLDGHGNDPNDDHRGIDHIRLGLDKHHSIAVENHKKEASVFMYLQLINCLYRIKGHKFEHYYETYCRVECLNYKKNIHEETGRE